MKINILKYLSKALLCLLVLGVFVVSCDEDEDSGAVVLKSFGPSPVLRGNEIRFIGENMNQVKTVIIPDNIEITSINVVSPSEIKVTVPQEAKVGHVTLVYNGGTITTKTILGYSEPYEINSISPVGTAIRAGQQVTVAGDYLNNIVKIAFQGNAVVVDSANFVSQSRKEIKLLLPKEAVSGKIYIEDKAGNQLYSNQELLVKQPAISGLSAETIKPGEKLKITGTDLDLVAEIVFAGGTKVNAADLVSQTATEISVATPANLQDGQVKLIAYSGVEFTSAKSVSVVSPSNIQIAAETRYKTGLKVKISGKDLDLVTGITFKGADAITNFSLQQNESGSGVITLAIPDKAISGAVSLSTKSGKSVSTPEIVLVSPVVNKIDPLTVIGGNTITITGTDLDLVRKVTFTGGLTETVVSNETSISVTVPANAKSGKIIVEAINGTQMESVDPITVVSPNMPVVTTLSKQVKPGGLLVIEGTKLNLIESVVFSGGIKATRYGSRTSTLFEVYVPETAKTGTTTVKLITFDQQEVESPAFNITGVDPILSSTVIVMDYEVHGGHNGYWDAAWDGNSKINSEGGNTFISYTGNANGWLMNCNHQSSGAPAPVISNIENYVLKLDVRIDKGVVGADNAQLQFVLGDKWNYWYGGGLLPASTDGEWVTISVPVSKWGLSGTLNLSSGTNGLYGGVVPAGVSLDNLRFDLK